MGKRHIDFNLYTTENQTEKQIIIEDCNKHQNHVRIMDASRESGLWKQYNRDYIDISSMAKFKTSIVSCINFKCQFLMQNKNSLKTCIMWRFIYTDNATTDCWLYSLKVNDPRLIHLIFVTAGLNGPGHQNWYMYVFWQEVHGP